MRVLTLNWLFLSRWSAEAITSSIHVSTKVVWKPSQQCCILVNEPPMRSSKWVKFLNCTVLSTQLFQYSSSISVLSFSCFLVPVVVYHDQYHDCSAVTVQLGSDSAWFSHNIGKLSRSERDIDWYCCSLTLSCTNNVNKSCKVTRVHKCTSSAVYLCSHRWFVLQSWTKYYLSGQHFIGSFEQPLFSRAKQNVFSIYCI